MEMAMASTEASARPPNGYSAAPSSNAPQGSNPMPNSQTPGHPSFRRCVEDRASSADRRNKKDGKLTCSANADSGHRELVRYVAIAFLLYRQAAVVEACRGTEGDGEQLFCGMGKG